jgi:hypothetical protein
MWKHIDNLSDWVFQNIRPQDYHKFLPLSDRRGKMFEGKEVLTIQGCIINHYTKQESGISERSYNERISEVKKLGYKTYSTEKMEGYLERQYTYYWD